MLQLLPLALYACSDPTVQQHGLTFRSVTQGSNQVWVAEVTSGDRSATLPFYHLPEQTLDANVPADVLAWLRGPSFAPDHVYVAVDPDATHYTYTAGVGLSSFIEDLGLFGGPRVEMAFSKSNQRPERLPVVDCAQAGGKLAVFVVEQGSNNMARRDGDCLRVVYHVPQDAIRVAERLEYGLIGVL